MYKTKFKLNGFLELIQRGKCEVFIQQLNLANNKLKFKAVASLFHCIVKMEFVV